MTESLDYLYDGMSGPINKRYIWYLTIYSRNHSYISKEIISIKWHSILFLSLFIIVTGICVKILGGV